MSGGSVAYQLRPNKFVERQLFIDLLSALCAGSPPSQYVYVSLGGPQLEDHKLVHNTLGIKDLISLESDPVVHKRQKFNCRPSYIKCELQETSGFIRDFQNFVDIYQDKRFIIWFDYAAASDRFGQISEYIDLLGNLQINDFFKITINANPSTLGEKYSRESEDELLARRAKNLEEQLHDLLPTNVVNPESMKARNFPKLLSQTIERASFKAVEANRRVRPVPLSIFTYQDGYHQMLTVTVAVIETRGVDEFRKHVRDIGWPYLPDDWTEITNINVPNLTAKERLYLEEVLFSKSDEEVHADMPFRFSKSDPESLQVLKDYAAHYRRYPSYFQVVI